MNLRRFGSRGAPFGVLALCLTILGGAGGCSSDAANDGASPPSGSSNPQVASSPATAPRRGQGSAGSTSNATGGSSAARAVAAKLRLPPRFLIGLGNDLPAQSANYDYTKCDVYGLPVKLDIHYVYLPGLQGQGGWPDYEPGGTFVDIHASIAADRGIVPMFTLYQAAAWGENDFDAFRDPKYMVPYWAGAKLLFQRLAAFGKPAIVHLEPDLWGFAQRASKQDDPSTVPIKVGSVFPDCQEHSDDIAGMGYCLVKLARTISPQVIIGFQASAFAADRPERVAGFLNAIGGAEADITVVETLDRDAGCFEAKSDPNCQRSDETFYWDETNQTHPNFHDHLAWAKAIHDGTGKPLLWWQTPLGVPKGTPGGSAGHYRDNRVKYFFEHPDELVAAGGIGAAFGVGENNQTTLATDGGQFKTAVTKYLAQPSALP